MYKSTASHKFDIVSTSAQNKVIRREEKKNSD